jgi:O-antigen/teichoic acid export membrane protein
MRADDNVIARNQLARVCENLSMYVASSGPGEQKRYKATSTFAKNSAANIVRMGATSIIAILLPAYLTHHLPVQTYGAWVLILQLGAYVGYLDFGVQTAVAKYIAEYEAKGDYDGCGRCASVGLVIMLAASVLGVFLTTGLAWLVPVLFRNMPAALYQDVRLSILLVGISLAIKLATSVFSAIFLGLQRYQIPMVTDVLSKLAYAIVLCLAVFLHSSLAVMGAAVASVNLLSALLQIVAWKKLAGQVLVSLHAIDFIMVKQMLGYCAVLTIWSACMLVISGIDITVVGHYAFSEVAFYSIATSPTNFMLMIIGAVLGPLLPATSALSTERSSQQMGDILLRTTRYSTILLLLSGLPALVGGYWMLRLWVGTTYAINSVGFLRILLLANIVRNLCAPYATMVVATARQRVATAAAIVEGLVNLVASIWLARHHGAIGVAMGTLLGSIAGMLMHFGVSMHYTRNLAVSRLDLFIKGLLRPAAMAIPSALLIPYWWLKGAPALNLQAWLLWAVTSLLLTWFASMTAKDRNILVRMVSNRMKLTSSLG